ncbi:DNA cytosine methyltransferase [Chloroflexota bacterium]
MYNLTHISLFTGIGGIDLAAEWAGFKTILMVENNDYCQKVLRKHWPDVPIIGDIKDVTKERVMDITQRIGCLYRQTQEQSTEAGKQTLCKSESGSADGRSEIMADTIGNREVGDKSQDRQGRGLEQDGKRGSPTTCTEPTTIQPITLITGGFPCQPVSQAGKRQGKDDDRWLWPEMLRVISEVRPTWVVAENVNGLLTMGFYGCLSDLEGAGYETIPFVIPACGVNAPHRRDRIFIVGYTKCNGYQNGHPATIGQDRRSEQRGVCELEGASDVADTTSIGSKAGISGQEQGEERESGEPINSREKTNVAYTESQSTARIDNGNISGKRQREPGRSCRSEGTPDQWAVEPELGRVATGISHRVDRLRCLGNAVVPQQIYPILQAIADIALNKMHTIVYF